MQHRNRFPQHYVYSAVPVYRLNQGTIVDGNYMALREAYYSVSII